jgi:uncharacterized membrane protein YphA (DoxX/SURF4 family)
MLRPAVKVIRELPLPELLVIGLIFLFVAGPALVILAVAVIVRRSRKRGEAGGDPSHQ